jgi:hypothetical protein
VLFFISIKFFYSHRYFLYGHCIFVSFIFFLIIIPVTYADSRAISFRSIGISRSTSLSHLKSSFVALSKRPAGATSDADGDSESPKRPYKFANPSDRIYIAPPCRFSCQRCAYRYIAIFDKNFPSYFIPNK